MFKKIVASALLCAAVSVPAFAEMKFAVTDVAGLESLQTEFGAFKKALEKATGEKIAFFPVNGRNAAVEALKNGKVDYVLTGPAEYVVFKEKAGAVPVVGWERPDYFAQIIVPSSSKIRNVKDLAGKKIAFGDIGSTSTHLGPVGLLAEAGLKPSDYKPLNIHRNVSVEAMKRGDIDAVGLNFGHLGKIRKVFKDDSFRVVARGADLPHDVWVAGKHISAEDVAKVKDAFLKNQDALLAAILSSDENKKYKGGHFIPTVNDSDYDSVRQMYTVLGMKFTNFADVN